MKSVFYLILVGVILLACSSGRTFAQCGVERWSVKTGTDQDVGLVNLGSKTSTTIASLSAITAPNPIPDGRRVQPTETTVWVLNATLKKYVRAYDSDYHMVLADDVGHTMIAEIPDPGCVGPGSPLAAGLAHARAQFDAVFTANTSFQNADVPVQITGVGFFDYLEGQEGVAPNGVELHPIIDIIFNPYFSIASSNSSLTIAQGSTNPPPWTVTSGVVDNNATPEAPHTEAWKAWLDGYGSAHTETLQQPVTIPMNSAQATLSFWLPVDTAETASIADDTLTVQI